MPNQKEDILSPNEPALILRYGSTTQKFFRLSQDVVLVGRARSCDIALVSPEVASIHCLVLRSADGWRLRDCTARGATRINGKSVVEEALCNGDVVQLGPFSFETQLPAVARVAPSQGEKEQSSWEVQRLQRSRRRLARIALRLRQRSRQAGALPPTLAELEQQAAALRELHRRCEAQLTELELAERELCQERRAFERSCAEERARLEQAARNLAEREADGASSESAVPLEPSTRETIQENVPRSVYIERDDALEQACRAQEQVAQLLLELEQAQQRLLDCTVELASLRAEKNTARLQALEQVQPDHLANLRRIRNRLAEVCGPVDRPSKAVSG